MGMNSLGKKTKKANQHRTATTTYPCSFPDLGDSAGAGRADLPVQRYQNVCRDKKEMLNDSNITLACICSPTWQNCMEILQTWIF
jgi:hypothetical protein